jgi:hypothetical protein
VLATINCAGERWQRLLITDGWGFIVAKGESTIRVLSPTGVEIASTNSVVEIAQWTSFARRGADIVAVMDRSGGLRVFEAINPEAINNSPKHSIGRREVLAMRASVARDAIVLLTRDGKAVLLPLPDP